MEIALIHDNQLLLGPMLFNYRMINSDLEDLGLEDTINPQSYTNIPIHFSDGLTHLLPTEKVIPNYDPKYHNVGNFTWEVAKENDIPSKVIFTYPIVEKTLEEVKYLKKQEISPGRKYKENTIINVTINGNEVQIPTSREERILLSTKLASSSGTYNYKFLNTWLEITSTDIQFILSEIDKVVQIAYDWELSKINEIDACQTIDEVYDVVIGREVQVSPE